MDTKAMTFITHQAIFNAVRCGDLQGLKEQLKNCKGEGTSEGVISELMTMQNDAGETLLYIAAEIGHREVFSFLLGLCDLEVLKIRANSDMNAFHVAAKRGHLVCIKDKKGQTALHMAVKGQSTSVVEEILQADLTILNERDKKGNTALHMATRKVRSQIVSFLLTYTAIDVNAINNQKETALDLADKLPYGDSALEIKEALTECGAKHARHIGKVNEAMELKRAVSDIKHEVQSQLIQNEKTRRRVSSIAKELKKIHREAVQNTINSVTVVSVLFGSIAFMALFSLPGQYRKKQPEAGEANIAHDVAFSAFCLLNATALFISLAVVVVQITLVAWDTRAQRQVVSVINKLMWAACACTCGAFLAICFVVVGDETWLAISVTLLGAPILLGTLAYLCYFVFRRRFGLRGDSQRLVKRPSGSKSFSWSYSVNISDAEEYDSDHEKIYAL
ncbi:ankyrin repeat-containing protein At2g01680 isoform X2 [Vigna angularis]|uniref:ankyrin repeat-containing protein At2g01680 isoform X2 n=1 Tax=Phaseolus angularis TaxID=3914 RepID=UPI0022B2EB73|nr:ankyrin repeat-containing protein At2g01680 isoform X2 [Vigna angularis]